MARSCELDSNHGPLDYCEGCDTCHACNEARIAELTAESQWLREAAEALTPVLIGADEIDGVMSEWVTVDRARYEALQAALQGEEE